MEQQEFDNAFTEQLKTLLKNPEVIESLKNVNSPEEVLEKIVTYIPDVDKEKALSLISEIRTNDELSDNELTSISGGGAITYNFDLRTSAKTAFKSLSVTGTALVLGTAIAGAAAYTIYKIATGGTDGLKDGWSNIVKGNFSEAF